MKAHTSAWGNSSPNSMAPVKWLLEGWMAMAIQGGRGVHCSINIHIPVPVPISSTRWTLSFSSGARNSLSWMVILKIWWTKSRRSSSD